MKNIDKILVTLRGFISTINRYPITILLFLFSAILTSYNISTNDLNNFTELLLTFIVGATIFMVLQMVFEHFYHDNRTRLLFGGLAILGAILYFIMIKLVVNDFSTTHLIRTMVFLFALFICFIWLPSIKSKIEFSSSFMAVFKAFFIVALYSGVLFLGITLIIMATDMLIVNVDGHAYSHVASIIAFVYAPIHFLSLIPVYPPYTGKRKDVYSNSQSIDKDKVDDTGRDKENLLEDNLTHQLNKAIDASKFLEGLVSYIIIPITVVFTIILLLYIVMNITDDFWKNNLMESLLVTYSITVIVVYLLASAIASKATLYFRIIFPKILIPVVLFQTISSVLKIGEQGITSGRYYVIMFGVFATISAITFSIRPNHKNNFIAPILIILSLLSILPPVDAFTISKANQINRLTNVLERNDMLKDDKILPKANIVKEDQEIIINSVRYLSRMDYAKDISWLHDYSVSYDFERIFGFSQYGSSVKKPESYQLYLADRKPIDISEYDFFVEANLFGKGQREPFKSAPWGDKGYVLEQENNDDIGLIILKDEQENELIRYSLSEIFDHFKDKGEYHGELSIEEAEFITENDKAVLCILVQSFNHDIWENSEYQNIQAYIMVEIK